MQNKLQLATPLLPAQVQQAGIRVTKSSNGYLLIAGFVSSDNSMSRYDIANYVVSHLQDPLSRINGVGNFNVFGTQYAMRIWLDTGQAQQLRVDARRCDATRSRTRTSRSRAASSAGPRRRRRSD